MWFTMPIWQCPACHHHQQRDDYYELHVDSELVCQKCDAMFLVNTVEAIMEIEIIPKPIKADAG